MKRHPEKPKNQRIESQSTTEEDQPFSNISGQLSHDCLVKVFQYLPIFDRVRCERVCKLWREASRGSWYNFRKLDLKIKTWGNGKQWENYFDYVKHVLERCGEFDHIDLSSVPWGSHRNTKSMKMFGKCPNLKELDLYYIAVGVPQLKFIVKHCGKIESIKLHRITENCNEKFLVNEVLGKLKLRCLHLSEMEETFNGSCLKALSPELIEEISLYECCSFDMKFMIRCLPTFKNLHTLKFRSTFRKFNPLLPREARLRDIVPLFRHLKELENLINLDISQNYGDVNDAVINELIPHLDRLTTLDISNTSVSDSGLSVITSSSSLRHLVMGCLYKVTGKGLEKMPNLRSLNCYSCWEIREYFLIKVLHYSENLEEINVSSCRNVTMMFIDAAENAVNRRVSDVGLKVLLGSDSAFRREDLPVVKALKFEFLDGYNYIV